MDILPTMLVKVKETGQECLINVSDFDESLHVKAEESATAAPTLTVEQIKARLDALKVPYDNVKKKADFEALLAEAEKNQAPAKPALSVVEKGDKFIIVNDKGEQQGEEFNTQDEANTMLNMLGGSN